MKIISLIFIYLLFIKYFPINSLNNHSLTMFIFTSSSSSSMNSYFKRHFSRHLNFTDDNYISSSTNRIQTLDINYNLVKEVSSLTKTQVKVILTVVLIISFIMLIIAIFRFKNACRTQETDNLQIDIIRNRASQYSEPSSRRGSVGYYTQKYNRTTNIRFDNQLNIPLPTKRLSIPACDQSSKSTAVVLLSSSPGDLTDATHHVTSSCDTSNIPNQQISIHIKPTTYKSSLTIATNQCDDRTPLLISGLKSTIKDSSTNTTRKYSLNALLPLIRPSVSHPLCSSLTSTIAEGINVGNRNDVDLKSRRRISLSSALRRTSFAKQPRAFCSTIDSLNTNKTISPPVLSIDSDSSERTSLLSSRKKQQRKKSSSITPLETTSLSSYQKDFMHKIERFRFIDDSASSTTTVTSPVENLEPINTRQTSNHIDDYSRMKHQNDNDDEANSLIDCLNSDLLTNGSYSDLNILNYHHHSSNQTILRPQTFKTVNPPPTCCQQHEYYQTLPINIPHSVTSLSKQQQQRHQIELNGYSHSMDFKPITNKYETSSSSSTSTLTTIRSSNSLEFDDNRKPSGVLVDDDFLPMSSPIDEHFWDRNVKNHYECFPNVGSSPDMEIKHFDLQQLNTLSETSDDDDDDDSRSSNIQSEIFSINEYKIKQLQKPLVIIEPILPIENNSKEIMPDKTASDPSINSTEEFNINKNSTTTSLIENVSTLNRPDIVCQTISSSEMISEEDDSSQNDVSEGDDDDSADNGEIDLVQEFELSQKEEEEEQQIKTNNLWSINDRDIYIIEQNDLISELVTTPNIINRTQPTSIMKISNNKTIDNIDEQQQQTLKPKVRFNLDPQYEREREWNKVNKLLGNSVEWTDEFEV